MWGVGEAPASRLRAASGFTLFELLVILAILSLLSGLVFPSLDKAMRRQTFIEAVTQFESALHAARARAIRSGGMVRFALSSGKPEFGARGELDRLPSSIVASAPDGAVDFFADGSASGGRITIVDGRWIRRWIVRPTTGEIERVQ